MTMAADTLAGGGKHCGLSKDAGRGELHIGEGGASRAFICSNRMRDSFILKDSLVAAQPKAEIGCFAAVNFRKKEFKVCHGREEL
jgi:hypothetical protein